jgi:hypothetical protein
MRCWNGFGPVRACPLPFLLGLLAALLGPVLLIPVPAGANPYPEEGACCFADGSCLVRDSETCWSLGGQYMGNNSSCDPDPCFGACCFPDGSCQFVIMEECTGSWSGYGWPCEPCNLCGSGDWACCVDGGCIITDPYTCCVMGGRSVVGADCEPDPCVPTPTRKATWGQIKALYP